jgi:predicted XRE-type DNA-binding protein
LNRTAARTVEKRGAEPAGVTPSSGNVFADLGLPDAVALDVKVRLAVQINRLIKDRQLTQVAAAKCLEVSRPKVDALSRYELDGFSVDRLMRFLLALGEDVEIRISARRAARAPGRIVVRRMRSSSAKRAEFLG